MGIAVSKHLDGKTFVFLSYTESGNAKDGSDVDGNVDPLGNRLYRYEYVDGQLINQLLLLDLTATPINSRGEHNGGKILIGPDNNIYLMIGEVGGHRTQAQNILDGPAPNGLGGVLRITQSGGIADQDNPIFGSGLPLNIYYAMGIRNSFGIDFDPLTGNLWDTENGPTIADEINLITPGFNGGWSQVQGYISQDSLGRGISSEDNLVYFGKGKYSDPKFVWVTTIGPTALKFLNSDKLGKEYANDMFTGDINNGLLYRFTLNEARNNISINNTDHGDTASLADNQVDETRENQPLIFGQGFGGITDLQVGPDGYLYVLSYTGALYRIVPLSESNIPKNQSSLPDDYESQSSNSIPVIISGIKGSQSYSPDAVRVETGQTITWYNGDTVSHTVTSGQDNDPDEGAAFDSDAIIPNQKYSLKFDSPGDYKYYCIYHPSMIGEIIVE